MPKSAIDNLSCEEMEEISIKAQMPLDVILSFKPTGYWILIREYEAPESTRGGLILPDNTKDAVEISTAVGLVIDMGNGAYKGKAQFDDGAWCDIGDYVVYNSYAKGFKRKLIDNEGNTYTVRLLADDFVMGVVDKPSRLAGIV